MIPNHDTLLCLEHDDKCDEMERDIFIKQAADEAGISFEAAEAILNDEEE